MTIIDTFAFQINYNETKNFLLICIPKYSTNSNAAQISFRKIKYFTQFIPQLQAFKMSPHPNLVFIRLVKNIITYFFSINVKSKEFSSI